MMKKLFLALALFCFAFAEAEEQRPTHVYLIGDSTCANKNLDKQNPERGWGQLFRAFFDEGVVVENHALNGRSTKSFREEGRWEPIYSQMQKGDYVFIQFGHNDASKKPERHASYADYRANLIRMINDVRAKGATPVLLTSMVQRTFKERLLVDDRLKGYPGIMRRLAKEMDVLLIDCHQKTRDFVVTIGDEASIPYYRHLGPGIDPFKPDGIADDTHMMEKGARRVAAFVAEGMLELDNHLSKYVVEERVLEELGEVYRPFE